MVKNLIIVESPTKARTIERYLKDRYKLISTKGHIMDLPANKLGVDIKKNFYPEYVPIKGKEKIIDSLKKASGKSGKVILATDPDREGEAIAYHIQNVIDNEVERVLFYEITEKKVIEALRNPGKIDMSKVDAQIARRILDRLVGYKISPLLWKVFKKRTLSAGRVQSVALRIICEREEEIRNFVPQEYWNIIVRLRKKEIKEEFNAKLVKVKPKTKQEAIKVVNEITRHNFIVSSFKSGIKLLRPKPPYITSTIQQEASANLNMSASRTMKIAQQLFEGIEVEGKAVGLITYMRTDSVRIAKDKVKEAREFIKDMYGKEYIPTKPNIYKEKKGAQGAHEAIRPTSLKMVPSKIRHYLTGDQYKIYNMIWKRFLASQSAPARYNTRKAIIESGQYEFEATSEILDFPGFLLVAGIKEKECEIIPELKKGEELSLVKKPDMQQEFTKSKPRYTEGSMVKELETKGIGRPSTYAPIIWTLLQREYVIKDKGKLIPTELGIMVNSVLIKNFQELFNVKFTQSMEEQLDRVEAKDMGKTELLSNFNVKFSKSIAKFDTIKTRESLEEVTDEVCDKCGKQMVVKIGRFGRFLACSGYPQCKNTRPLKKEQEKKIGEKCPECGKELVIKDSRFGRFIACSGYPECKFTKPLGTGINCPECGNEIIERKTKRGRTFYGCKNYPKCKFSIWNPPFQKTCPECGCSVMEKRKKALVCPKCGYKEKDKS